MTYGEKIAQLRKNANLTQAELGEKLGVTAQAVSKWERDMAEPDLGTFSKLASILGISVEEFLDTTHEVQSNPASASNMAAEIAPIVAETVVAGMRENIASSVREEVAEQTTAVSEAVKEVQESILGHCTVCGITVKENNKGQVKPKVLCVNCYKKQEAERKQAEQEAERTKRSQQAALESKRNKCLFWGIVAGLLVLGGAIIAAIKLDWSIGARVGLAFAGLWAAYAVLGVICEVFLSDSAVANVMEWCLTRSISWPGVIFSLDFGGIIFLIAVKILFAVIGFIVGVALFFVGLSISMIIATFTFPFTMRRIDDKISGKLPINKEDLI